MKKHFVGTYLILVTLLAMLNPIKSTAQELNCMVDINADNISGSEHVFENLKEAVNEYMNNNKFSNAQFSPNEKIECRLFLTIKEYANDVIKGDLQIQSTRPVYNSSYTTTLLNLKDTNIEFTYLENEQLVFSETTMESNLTAILNFYAYLILAVDFDSFSPRGGQAYLDKLSTVVQLAQSAGEIGWKAFDDNQNRWAIMNSFTDPSTESYRDLLYTYHRRGLDEMSIGPDKGRATITQALQTLQTINDKQPMSVLLNMWHDAKLDELINVYSKGSESERDDVFKLLSTLYPTDTGRLNDIKNPPTNR